MKFLENVFIILYNYYNVPLDDPFFSSVLTLSLLLSALFSVFLNILCFLTGIKLFGDFMFITLIAILNIIVFFKKRKYFDKLIDSKRKINKKMKFSAYIIIIFLLIIWSVLPHIHHKYCM
jgi:ABC-type nickel/cobalt efflux system permease component RcnA